MKSDLFLEPEQHRVTCSVFVVTQIMVKRNFSYRIRLQQANHLFGPVGPHPALRRGPLIVQKDLHSNYHSCLGQGGKTACAFAATWTPNSMQHQATNTQSMKAGMYERAP